MTLRAQRQAAAARGAKVPAPDGGRSIQAKFFALLADRVKLVSANRIRTSRAQRGGIVGEDPEASIELVTRGDWANTGNGYIQCVESFKVVSQFHYDFQADYATFRVNGREIYAAYAPKGHDRGLGEVVTAITEGL